MISIGTIAGGIAREFNNILIGPKSWALSVLDKDIPEEMKKEIRDFIAYCNSGEKLLRTLIGITGAGTNELQEIEINELIEDILILINSIFEEDNIEIIKDYGPVPEIFAKGQELREAFVSILLNSRDLIKSAYERGEITITTKSDREYIKMIFADSGEGINREELKEIFNPSAIIRGALSKKILPRTGQSLVRVYTIIEEHKGKIEVESYPGKGSNFIIWLPIRKTDNLRKEK
jgi:two-component system, NtrC family, sensor kinase